MLDRGISTRRGIMCAHRELPYAGEHYLPQSEDAQDRYILLPLYSGLDDADAERVVEALRSATGAGA